MKIKLKENEAAEMRKLEEWARSQEQRLSEVAAKKEEQKAREAAKYRRVAADMDNARKEQEETEQLLIELFIEEADQKIRQAAEDREARRLALRREMQEAHRQQQVHTFPRRFPLTSFSARLFFSLLTALFLARAHST